MLWLEKLDSVVESSRIAVLELDIISISRPLLDVLTRWLTSAILPSIPAKHADR